MMKNIQLKLGGVHSGYELKLFAVSNRLLVINQRIEEWFRQGWKCKNYKQYGKFL